jgi:proteasome lid subunit RPN8/RPN11
VVGESSASTVLTEDALVLTASQRQEIVNHALEGGDDEVCGFLFGLDGQVDHVERARNAAAEISADEGLFRDRDSGLATAGRSRAHYYVDSHDLLKAYNSAAASELDVIGVYHSHTHTEARPSPTDIRLAHDGGTLFYVLVGLRDRTAPEFRAWRIHKADPWGEDGEAVEVTVVDRR